MRLNEISGAVHGAQVFSLRRDMLPTDLESIRKRLNDLGLDGAEMARRTQESARTVQGYLSKVGREIPASFIAKLEANGVASARWLLTEEGPRDVASPDLVSLRLEAVQKIARGKVPEAALRAFVTPPSGVGGSAKDAIQASDAQSERAKAKGRRKKRGGGGPDAQE